MLAWLDEHPGWRVYEVEPAELGDLNKISQHFSGMITWSFERQGILPKLATCGLPIVDCGITRAGEEQLPMVSRITFDRSTIHGLAIDHFAELGLEIVGYVGTVLRLDGQLSQHVAPLQAIGLSKGMEWQEHDLGLEKLTNHWEAIWELADDERLMAFLKNCPKPIGLLTEDDYIGVLICEAARKLGISLPGEIAVMGQGNRVLGQSGSPTLSSVVIPGREVGAAAAAMLDEWIKTGIQPANRMVPCTEVAFRESTGGLSRHTGIERAKRYMELHAVEGTTVSEIANIAGCSIRTLRQRFEDFYGIDVADHLRHSRRDNALRLIAKTDLPIAEIAKQCGFHSPSNFFNFVKRHTGGIGPQEYRKQFGESQPEE
ncbi:MAG: helix-turn-helix domain-containing protein [Luteolibacter sp.]